MESAKMLMHLPALLVRMDNVMATVLACRNVKMVAMTATLARLIAVSTESVNISISPSALHVQLDNVIATAIVWKISGEGGLRTTSALDLFVLSIGPLYFYWFGHTISGIN